MSGRGLDGAQAAAMAAAHRQVVPLIEFFFDSGTLQLALARSNFTSLSGAYIAAGPLASIDPAAESALSQEGLQLQLTGLDVAAITIAATEPYRGRIVRLLKGILNADSNDPIGQPVPFFIGRLVNMTITEDNAQCSIAVIAEHYEIELTRAAPTRWSDSDQQRLFPGDKGCAAAAATSAKTVIWPSRAAQGG